MVQINLRLPSKPKRKEKSNVGLRVRTKQKAPKVKNEDSQTGLRVRKKKKRLHDQKRRKRANSATCEETAS